MQNDPFTKPSSSWVSAPLPLLAADPEASPSALDPSTNLESMQQGQIFNLFPEPSETKLQQHQEKALSPELMSQPHVGTILPNSSGQLHPGSVPQPHIFYQRQISPHSWDLGSREVDLGFIFPPHCRIEIYVTLSIGAKRRAGNWEAEQRIKDWRSCGLFWVVKQQISTTLLFEWYSSYMLDMQGEGIRGWLNVIWKWELFRLLRTPLPYVRKYYLHWATFIVLVTLPNPWLSEGCLCLHTRGG